MRRAQTDGGQVRPLQTHHGSTQIDLSKMSILES